MRSSELRGDYMSKDGYNGGNKKPHDGTKNLRPVKTKEEARERGRNGGKKSAEVRQQKKIMSEMYLAALASKLDIVVEPELVHQGNVVRSEKTVKLEGQALVNHVFGKVLSRGDSASVALVKEFRETLEGSKLTLGNDPDNPLFSDEAAAKLLAKHGVK